MFITVLGLFLLGSGVGVIGASLSISCPPEVTVTTDSGLCTASGVSLGTPTVSNNTGPVTVTNNAPLQFPLGVTIVKWTAVEDGISTNTCEQRVLVQEAQPLILDCPQNKTVEYGANWNFDEPTVQNERVFDSIVFDNSVNDLVIRFDPGTNEIGDEIVLAGTARYLKTFMLEYWGVNLSGGNSFAGSVTARLRLYANNGPTFHNYPSPGTVLYDSGEFAVVPSARATLDFTEFLDYGVVPLTQAVPNVLTWSIQFSGLGTNDRAGIDLYSPPVVGQDYPDYWYHNSSGWELRTNVTAAMDFAALAYASHVDGRTELSVVSTVTNRIEPGDAYTAIRTWRAIDPCGGTATCSQTVSVRDTTLPVITCPSEVRVNTDPGQCVATGVNLGTPVVSDNSATVTVTNDAPVQLFLGSTVVTWIAYDASGNTNTCTQKVTVQDTELPLLSCDNVVTNTTGLCNQFVIFSPIATDNCGLTNVSCIPPSGARFQVGTTIVNCKAVDYSGNTSRRTFTVAVLDLAAPVITAPANIVTNVGTGCTQVVNFAPGVTDNCLITNVTCVPRSGSAFILGTTPVTCIATDRNGNSSSCSFSVTVRDFTPPTLTLNGPNPLILECHTVYNELGASANDGCAGDLTSSVAITGSLDPNLVGSYTLRYSVSDGYNTVSAIRTVNVVDTTAPEIVCPGNITQFMGADCQAAVPDILGMLTVTDNCDARPALSQQPIAGTILASGNHTITVTATDAHGNTSQCSLNFLVVEPPPTITTQPKNQTNVQGTALSLTVTARACSAMSYQWYFGHNLLDGQTAMALNLDDLQPAHAGDYKVVVTSLAGGVTSLVARVTVLVPATILQEPVSLTVTQGNQAVFSIVAIGDMPLAYQWYFNTTNLIAGTTNATLLLSSAQPTQAGAYHAVVSNAASSATSAVARLFVRQPPLITLQPQNRNVVEGTNYTFSVAAVGDSPVFYQWRFNGTNLVDQTNTTLALINLESKNSGGYQAVLNNSVGVTTSVVAVLTVRRASDPAYAPPENGWAYIYTGDGTASSDGHALDGTWDHKNQSDSWYYDGRGLGNGLPGGLSSTGGILSLEDAITSGTSDIDNRRYYFTHNLNQEPLVTNPSTLLNDGVTLSFRARLTPPPPLDPDTELSNAPNGYVNNGSGRGMFGIRQAGGGGMIISFSLNQPIEDINTTSNWNFGQAGLHMNNLNGNVRTPMVDPNLGGTVNLLPLDSSVFHEFWINIQENGSAPGTHQVSVYVDGSLAPNVFNVTAGSASDISLLDPSSTNYVALGLGNTAQRGAVDVDYFAYQSGVIAPMTWNEPVGIVLQPTNQLVSIGQAAVFNVGVTGTPPFAFQWYQNERPIPNATNAIYTTVPTVPADHGSEIVVVASNICNLVTSTPPAILRLLLPPTIVTQPEDQVVADGTPASFSITISSETAVTYQWRFNGANLPEQTNATLYFSAVTPANAGLYDALVANNGGTVTSTVARLTVHVLDFGDAPAPFPTLLASNGARHLVIPGIFLGMGMDSELDGRPDPLAAAEANDDGIRFTGQLQVGQIAGLEIVASTNGFLNAWMDCNGNDSWADGGDQIFTNKQVVAGTNALNFLVPAWTSVAHSFARFRFNTTGNLGFSGVAADGEVEDYAVTLAPVADLSLTTLAAPTTVAMGSNVVYTITVFNAGPSAASAITLNSQLSPNAVVISMLPSQGNCAPAGNNANCILGNLTPQSFATVTLTVNATALGTISNRLTVAAQELDLLASDNTVSASTEVQQAPGITLPPASLTVTQGQTATFTVLADGTGPLFYQWLFEDAALSGQTNAIMSVTNAQPGHAGNYQVRVSNGVGGTLSAPASLTVLVPPSIVQQPQSSTNNNAGNVVLLDVVGAGTTPLDYQWYFNGTSLLASETNSTLVISNAQAIQSGDYHVVVANAAGSISSQSAYIRIVEWDFGDAPDPSFATWQTNNGARHIIRSGFSLGSRLDFEADGRPASGAGTELDDDGVRFETPLLVGQTSAVSIVASASGWLNAWVDFDNNGSWADAGEHVFANHLLATGTNHLTLLVPVSAQPASSYARFRFSSARDLSFMGDAPDGEVEDYQVTISPAVDLELQISDEPAAIALGSNMILTLLLTNFGPSPASSVTLQDLLPTATEIVAVQSSQGNCANVAGVLTCAFGTIPAGASVSTRLTLRPLMVGSFTNSSSVASAEIDLNTENNFVQAETLVQEFPVITQQPQSQIVTNGDTALFEVTAVGTDLGYEWYLNGEIWPGANKPKLRLTNASPDQAGVYTVRVTNLVGTILSEPASLTVLTPAHITAQPQSVMVVAGQAANFEVQANGTAPLVYHWQFNGNPLPDETQPILAFSNVQSSHEGEYRVRVSNMAGEELSAPAYLTVLDIPVITQQPQNQTICAGREAVLQVSASEGVQFQWYSQEHGMLAGATNASITWSNVQKLASGGYWVVVSNPAGSVTSETAQLTILEMDFGDAANSYSTLLAFNGARHELVAGIYLGSGIDFEADGQPDAIASGDDVNGQSDEDGVHFTTALHVGQLATLQVVASVNGSLDAWIDFNDNGTWADLEEQVFTSQPLSAGTNILSLQIPSSAVASNTFARFRFSTVGGLNFDGPAPNGEVEDYSLEILPVTDLALTVTANPARVPAGAEFVYTIAVTNGGSSRAERVIITNALPGAVSLISFTPSAGACVNNGPILTCDLGALSSQQEATVTVVVGAPQGTQMLTNTVWVWAGELDTNPANNEARLITPVVGYPAPFENGETVLLPDYGPAAIYPSTIAVSGVTAAVYKVSVTLRNLTHAYPSDLDILLVSPSGQSVLLMSGVGSGFTIQNITLTFDDEAGQSLPERMDSGVFKPTYRGTPPASLPVPAPVGPFGNQLAVFRGTDPNGVWSLYIADDSLDDGGYLANGWSLQFETLEVIADLAVTQMPDPSPAIQSSNLVYNIVVNNFGPAGATRLILTDELPPTTLFVSASTEMGSCTHDSGVVTCAWDSLPAGSSTLIRLMVKPAVPGWITNKVSISGGELDLVSSNNAVSLVTAVKPIADLRLTLLDFPASVSFPQQVTYRLVATNQGPSVATDVQLINNLSAGLVFISANSSQGTCALVGNTVTCAVGDIPAGGSAMVIVTAEASAVVAVTNTATVSTVSVDFDQANNSIESYTKVVVPFGPFENLTHLDIPQQGLASLYPSTTVVSGLTGEVYRVTVTLSNLSHSAPADLDLLLVGPSGESVVLMSDAGGNLGVSNLNLTFDDAAENVPEEADFVSGTFKPTNYGTEADTFPSPAPVGPHGAGLSIFHHTNPNGVWSLYVSDDQENNGGSLEAWSLNIETFQPIIDLSISGETLPDPVGVGSNLVFSLVVSNAGPAPATGIFLTNVLPANVTFTAVQTSQGSCAQRGGTITCDLGMLGVLETAQISIEVVPTIAGQAINSMAVTGVERDLQSANNLGQVIATIEDPPIIVQSPLSQVITNADSVGFSVTATGAVPMAYQWQQNGIDLPQATNAMLALTNASFGSAGTYVVRVQNRVGAVWSQAANLVVLPRSPVISAIPDQVIDEDTVLGPIPFHVGDFEIPAENLLIRVSSSNQALVPDTSILLAGDGSNRTLRLVPVANQFGESVITLTVDDGGSTNNVATRVFLVTVRTINDLPAVSPIAEQNILEDTATDWLPFSVGDVEDSSDALVVTVESSAPEVLPLESIALSGVGSNRMLRVTPPTNSFGIAIITLTVRDTQGGGASTSFRLNIIPVNDWPTLDPLADTTILMNSGQHAILLTGISSGAFNEPQLLSVTASDSPAGILGNLQVIYDSPGSGGSVIFETLSNVIGQTAITVTVNDGGTSNNVMTRTFRVKVNSPPAISLISDIVLLEDTVNDAIAYTVADEESDPTLLEVSAHSSNQALIPDENISLIRAGYSGFITINPLPNAYGTTWITATVTDPDGATSNSMFQVTVTPVNDRPTLDPLGDLTINEDAGLQTVPLTGVASGATNELQTLTLTAEVSPAGILTNLQVNYTSPNTTGSLSFGTVSNATGTALVTVIVDDGDSFENLVTRTFLVNVLSANDPPFISPVAGQMTGEDTLLGPVAFQVSDLETPADNLVLTATSSDSVLIPSANIVLSGSGGNRTFQVLPGTNQGGIATITLRVRDEGGLESSASFSLLVFDVNDAPCISVISDQVTDEDVPKSIGFVVTDAESAPENLLVVGASSNPALLPTENLIFDGTGSNRVLTILPETNQFGRTTITIQVSDQHRGVSTRSFELIINPVNDSPSLDPIIDMIIDEDAGEQVVDLTGLFSGSSNELQNLVITAVSSDPSLIPDPLVRYTFSAPVVSTNAWPATNTAPLVYCAGPTNFPSADFQLHGLNTYLNAEPGTRLRQSGVISAVAAWLNPGTNVHQFRVFRHLASTYTMVSASEWITNNVLGSNYFVLSKPMPCLEGDYLGLCTKNDDASIFGCNLTGSANTQLRGSGDLTSISAFPSTNGGLLLLKGYISAPVVAYAGDSIMAGWTEYYNWIDDGYFPLFGNLAHTIPFEVQNLMRVSASYRNYSKGGVTYEWVAQTAIPQLLKDQPLILVCQAGINDIGDERPWPDVLANLNSIRAQWPITNKLYICEIMPLSYFGLTIRTWNTNLALWCASNQATLIKVHDLMGQIRASTGQLDDLAPGYDADGIHLTQAGIDAYAYKVAQYASDVQYSDPSRNGTLTFTPSPNASGVATIYVQVNDRQSINNLYTQSFQVRVRPVNDLPTINIISDQVTQEDLPTAPVLVSIGDVETPASQLLLTAHSSNPDLLPLTNIVVRGDGQLRTIMLIPAFHQSGTAQITLTVMDSEGGSASNVFNLTVHGKNDTPTLDAIADVLMPQNSGERTVSLTGISSGTSNESQMLTVTAVSSRPELIPAPIVDYTSPASSGTLMLAPVLNGTGSAVITVTVSDGQATNASISRSFLVTVEPVNQSPTVDPIADVTLPENSPEQTILLTGLSSGATNELQNLLLTVTSSNPDLIASPMISYTNSANSAVMRFGLLTNATGTAIMTVTVNDNGAENNLMVRTFKVTVTPVNHLPVISALPDVAIDEDLIAGPIAFSVEDTETSANLLTLSGYSSNPALVAHSKLLFGGSGTLRTVMVKPAANESGSAVITITVTDSAGASASNSFVFTVAAVNDAPTLEVLLNRTLLANAGAQLINLTGISSGASNENQTLSVTAVSSNPSLIPDPTVNYASPNPTGTLTLSPVLNTNGTATITVTVHDGGSSNNLITRSFETTVMRMNSAPVIGSITNVVGNEDTTLGPIAFAISDQETPADSLTITLSSSNTNLVAESGIFVSGGGTNPAFLLTPNANQFGSTTITLTVHDPEGATANTSFLVTINPVNDPPNIASIPNQTVNENSSTGAIPFLVGDIDTADTSLTLSANSSNLALIPLSSIVFGGSGSNRTVTVTPAFNQIGTATITVTVSDGLTNSSTNFVVTVNPVNEAPFINAIGNQTVNEDTTLAVPFTIGDLDTPLENLIVTVASSNPALATTNNSFMGGNGSNRIILVTPLPDQNGEATITLTVSDGMASNSSSFVLTVTPVNDPPTLNQIGNFSIPQDSGIQTVPLAGIAAGPANEDSQVLSITAVSSNPGLIPNPTINYTSPSASGSSSFTPVAYSNGTAVITVTINDGQTQSNLATRSFTVTVTPLNLAPTISAISAQNVNEDTLLRIPFTVGDWESPAGMLTLTAASTNTSLVEVSNIIFSGTGSNRTANILPVTNQFGASLITFTVSDGTASASTSFLLTVAPVNDPPTIDEFPPVYLRYRPGSINVPLTGITSGASNENQILSLTVSNSNTGFYSTQPYVTYTSPSSTATLTFHPGNFSTGTNRITVTVNDGGASNNVFSQAIVISVMVSGNTTPIVVTNISDQTIFEDSATAALPFNIRDSVTSANLLSVSGTSSNPLLLPQSGIVFGGSGSNRTVTLTPAANQSGSATVTISVTDTNYGGTNFSFALTVTPVNDLPNISGFSPVAVNEETTTGPIAFTVSDLETPAGSLIVTATSSNPTLVPGANIVVGGSGTNRVLLITPATNQTGTATITISVSDGTGSSSNSFVLTVNGVNDPPSISSVVDQTMNEDAPLTVNFTVGDAETAAASLTLTGSCSTPALLTNIVFGGSGPNRTVTLTPVSNQVGRATITITVTDGNGASAGTTFLLTVNPVNDPPSISGIPAQAGNEDTTVGPIGFTIGDFETPSGALVLRGTSSNPTLLTNIVFGGSGSNRTMLLQPITNQTGTATITVVVADANGDTATNAFVLTINGLNDPPFITTIPDQTANEHTATGAIGFTIGDSETAAASLTLTGTSSNPALVPDASITFGGNGSNRTVTLTPAANQTGTALITVTVTDANSASASSTFNLRVMATNHPPVISNIPDLATLPGVATRPIGFSIGDAVTSTELLVLSAVSGDTALVPNNNIVFGGSGTNRTVTVQPLSQPGDVTITVTVQDTNGAWANDSFVLHISSTNLPMPLILDIPDQVMDMNSSSGPLAFSVGNVKLPSTLVLSASSSNPSLVPAGNIVFGGSGTDRTVTLTPVANQFGTATITVTATETNGGAGEDIFVVQVNPIDYPPSISSVSNQTLAQDSSLGPISFIVGDAETAAGLLIVSASSSNPVLLPDTGIVLGGTGSNRTVTLTPAIHASGQATVTLLVIDGSGATATTAFLLTVTPINYPPTISSVADHSIPEDTSTGSIPFTVYDLETAADNLVVTALSSNETLIANITLGGNGNTRTITVNPAPNQFGTTLITLTVADGEAATSSTSFLLTVNPVNDAPFISALADQTTGEDTPTPIIDFAINDLETAASDLILTAYSSNPDLVPASNILLGGLGIDRTVAIIPATNQFGTALITLAVTDSAGASASNHFVLTVKPVNDLPVIGLIPDQVTDENVATPEIAFTINDIETPAANLLLLVTSSNPVLVPDNQISLGGSENNPTMQLMPAVNQSGTAVITVMAVDEQGGITSRAFGFTVNSVNQPPTILSILDQVIEEGSHSGAIPIVVRDTETAADALIVSGTSSNPTLIPDDQIQFTGSGMNRVLTLSGTANQSGNARITISVTDGGGASASSSFEVTVNSVNDLPVISAIADQVTEENTPTGPIEFVVGDLETPASNLVVTVQSSAPVLVPQTGLVLGGSASNRNLTITPAAGQFGVAIISVTVTDSKGGLGSNTFVLIVSQTNFPPVITTQPQGQTVPAGATVTLNVTATGAGPLAYQWLHQGLELAGQTNATLLLTNIQAAQAGSYTVRVIGASGIVSSDPASLRVLVSPTIAPLIRSNGFAVILVTTLPGLQYTVEYKNALEDAQWTVLDIRTGTGGVIEFQDLGVKGPARFYRAQVE